MARVQANYLLTFKTETFVLDDSTRSKQNTLSDDLIVKPQIDCCNNNAGLNGVSFEYNNLIKIKRVRVDSVGAPGLQRPYNGSYGYAARIHAEFLTTDGNNTALEDFILRVPNYNTWYDSELVIRPFASNTPPDPDPYNRRIIVLNILQSGTTFNYDGYNMSAVYVGENWNPVVNIEVETSGVYDSLTGVLF